VEWIDLRAEIPWLSREPYWLSHADGARLRSALSRLGFATFEARPGAVAEEQLRRSMTEAMGLAEYGWKNWDAFVDAFGGLVRSTDKPIALIWMDPKEVFVPSIEDGLRQYWVLASILGEWNRLGPECHQVALFLQGDDR
jgi:hypothetical protein